MALFYIAPARNEAKGPETLALPLERQLISLLYTRAEAHKLHDVDLPGAHVPAGDHPAAEEDDRTEGVDARTEARAGAEGMQT